MEIAGVDISELKNKYGTPFYVYDVELIKSKMDSYHTSFQSSKFKTEVIYASKAFCVKEMLRIVKEKELSLDVVSLGELATAVMVDFPMEHVYFHGNNKSRNELEYALDHHVGMIVVDNLMELKELEDICYQKKMDCNILIRMNVGVEAHTHKFIVTAHVDSKFGVSCESEDYKEMKEIFLKSNYIHFKGFHSHIGSQIFDMEGYHAALKKLIGMCKEYSYPLILNIGGGFGAYYTEEDKPIAISEVCKDLISSCEALLKENNIEIEKLCIEPGRSIVAEAGSTVYTIGYIKKTLNKLYYFIDGGMTDNIRPALYQAKYNADVVHKEHKFKNQVVTIAGKCCESGDLIIENALLPPAKPGDLLITYSTGAYGYSMSSNYNKALTPCVIFVENGKERMVCRRQSIEELLEREI